MTLGCARCILLASLAIGASAQSSQTSQTTSTTQSTARINEVSDKGTSDICSGQDWIELYNPITSGEVINLTGYALHDEKGPNDEDAYTFPLEDSDGNDMMLQPGVYMVLCAGYGDASVAGDVVPFGIGGDDVVTLTDPSGNVVSSTGSALTNRGEFGVSLAYDETASGGGGYFYTTSATPGEANVITALPEESQPDKEDETAEDLKTMLKAQNDLGVQFFNMDNNGMPVEGGYSAVVDVRIIMDPNDKADISGERRGYEMYSPFTSVQVTSLDDPTAVLAALTSPGRIRPKGQSTMYIGVCANRTTPYQLDLDYTDPDQNLFGSTKVYLRTAFGDPSYVREWASHRMLARFGLPHLRTRTVRLLINDEVYGLYNLMEAPDQDYVFYRSFPDFDPETYGLYKVKTQSVGCGLYGESELSRAEERINEDSTPPYVFERGNHRPLPPVMEDEMMCFGPFLQNLAVLEAQDVELAYLRSGAGKCGEFLVDQGLIDRDLGDKSLDMAAAAFIDAHLAANKCDAQCANSDLANDVNVEQFLRNFAMQAATLHQDSPLGNGNNWYLAYPGVNAGDKWNMVQYDHNNIMSLTSAVVCDNSCTEHLMTWSILRPTCRSLESNQMAGPLLTDDVFRGQFVQHVREFVNNVMANENFLAQIEEHLASIKDLVAVDPWGDYAPLFESHEMSGGDQWLHMLDLPPPPGPSYGRPGLELPPMPYIPLLPSLRARASEIQKQLDALDSGTYPRTKMDDYNPGEPCADWTAASSPDFPCHNNCQYEGCGTSGIFNQAFCDPDSSMCFKGFLELDCVGVENGKPVPSGSEADDAAPSFCLTFDNFPIKAIMCPTPHLEEEGMTGFNNMTGEEVMTNGSGSEKEDGGSGEGGGEGGNKTSARSSASTFHLFVVTAGSLAAVVFLY